MEFIGKKITVIGLARSGFAAAKLLSKNGAIVFVSDSQNTTDIIARADALSAIGVKCELGGHTDLIYKNADEIILSPGVPSDIPILTEAKNEKPNLKIISEIELAFRFAKGKIIGITGSNGKSTVTALVGKLFETAGYETYVVGNIGKAVCEIVEDASEKSVIVIELSSFQLETIDEFRPFISCLLNLQPDHLDRYSDVEKYYLAKQRIFNNQRKSDFAVLSAEDLKVARLAGRLKPSALFFGLRPLSVPGVFVRDGLIKIRKLDGDIIPIINVSELGIPGPHNIANACAAIACTIPFDIDSVPLADGLRSFKGLPHRLQFAGKIGDVVFINDSKATNTDALECALKSFDKPITLIAGGYDKGNDFAPLKNLAASKVKAAVLIGKTADRIAKDWAGGLPIERVVGFDEAIRKALEIASPDGIVLLSPGCASYDMFKNFEDRGERFMEIVEKLAKESR